MDGNLYFWETEHFKYLGELATGSIAIYSLSILNSKYLLTASEDQTIRAYDIMRIQPGKSFSHEHFVFSLHHFRGQGNKRFTNVVAGK